MSDIDNNIKTQEISYGKIISKDSFQKQQLFPDQLKTTINNANNYLLIFIPGDKQAKVNIFPVGNKKVKKILINLEKFSPDLVKGISDVLKEVDLADKLIHTTGLCFSQNERCFYETYVDFTEIGERDEDIESLKNKLSKVPQVIEVCVINIEQNACN